MKALRPYDWVSSAAVYNKRMEKIPSEWFTANVDVVAVLFSAYGVDRNDIIRKFGEIFENVKIVNLPIEVINVPMDENESDMMKSYEQQANWFTLKFNDPLIHILKYLYEITCIPFIKVLKMDDLSVISSHGISDIEQYGKNAVMTWFSTSSSLMRHRNTKKETTIYGDKWKFLLTDEVREYKKKFPKEDPSNDSNDFSIQLSVDNKRKEPPEKS